MQKISYVSKGILLEECFTPSFKTFTTYHTSALSELQNQFLNCGRGWSDQNYKN